MGQDDFSEREQPADVFLEVMNRFSEMLIQRMLQNLFLKETEITYSSENGTDEAGTQSGISQ